MRLSIFLLVIAAVPQMALTRLARACELGVYTYDSIAGKGGLGSEIFPAFEKLTGCKVRVLASGDAIQALSRVEIDEKRGKPEGDVILGVDTLLWERVAKVSDPSFSLDRTEIGELAPEVASSLVRYRGFMPYDFGALALMADQQVLEKAHRTAPASLQDLTRPEWRRDFILEDPRTSTPGLQFVLFTHHILGSRFKDYWKSLRSQWLAMPPGWDSAYGMFLKGAAPLVWSYVTSEAYHREHGSARYHAILFKEGQPLQLEGATLVRGAAHLELARRFLKFLVSEEVQKHIAATNWMWPARRGISVPRGFRQLPQVEKGVVLSGENSAEVLREWSEAIHE